MKIGEFVCLDFSQSTTTYVGNYKNDLAEIWNADT